MDSRPAVSALSGIRMSPARFRAANPRDAESVALLHVDSWRRFYRGAFSDSFLDGDVVTDRLTVWSARLAEPAHSATILAEDDSRLVGFVHVILDNDGEWGSLVDNLHVVHDRHGGGVGRKLVKRAADAVAERAASKAMYLWVLEQNVAAQGFYRAIGGSIVEKALVNPPGGRPDWLNGSPSRFRISWPDVSNFAGHSA